MQGPATAGAASASGAVLQGWTQPRASPTHLSPLVLLPQARPRTQRAAAVHAVAAAAKAVLHDTPMEVDTAPGYSTQGGRGRGGRAARAAAAARGRGRGGGAPAGYGREEGEEQGGPAWPPPPAQFG